MGRLLPAGVVGEALVAWAALGGAFKNEQTLNRQRKRQAQEGRAGDGLGTKSTGQ